MNPAASGGFPGPLRSAVLCLMAFSVLFVAPLTAQIPPDSPPVTEPGDPPAPPEATDPPQPVQEEPELRNLPIPGIRVPADWRTGIWEWDREDLVSTRALTLLELLEQVPGVLSLRGGDYGQPQAASAFGLTAGRVRVHRDGIELPPLDGGSVDLSRLSLAGVDRVRVERRPGELRVDLVSLRFQDERPFTLIEVGTGDLNTNLFRGTFGHPTALGGNLALTLDRIETEGPFRREPGAAFGAHVRHTVFVGARGAVAWEFRRMTSRRPVELWAPRDIRRSDLRLEARRELAPGILVNAFVQRASLDADPTAGEPTQPPSPVNEEPRTQFGARAWIEREAWWLEGEVRQSRGEGWLASAQALRGGVTVPAFGGVSASMEREGWREGSGTVLQARAWSVQVAGFSLFGEAEDGRRGVPFLPPLEVETEPGEPEDPGGPGDPGEPEAPPAHARFTEGGGVRGGIEFRRGGLSLGFAGLALRSDSLPAFGLPFDRGGDPLSGGSRSGLEVSGRIPLDRLLDGLSVTGAAQAWSTDVAWRYLPEHTYQARLAYRNIFFPTGNLEIWADVGVRGRDAMWVSVASPAEAGQPAAVPSLVNWSGRLQFRIASAHLFILWDNFTVRQENRDFPDRFLVPTRAMYGVRWTLWN